VTFLNLLAVAGLLGRFPHERVYAFLPLTLIMVLLVYRLILALNLRWFYPVLFVSKDVMIALQSVLGWGLAGAFFEARQAKRLFPMLTSGSIAGISLGSIITPVLVGVLGSENILLAWVLMLALGYALMRRLPGYEGVRANGAKPAKLAKPASSLKTRRSRGAVEHSFVEEIRRGYQYVRQSNLMRWFALSSVFFSILWFSLLLPFSRLATARYPDADALASFLGLFQGVQKKPCWSPCCSPTACLAFRVDEYAAGHAGYLPGWLRLAVGVCFIPGDRCLSPGQAGVESGHCRDSLAGYF
jgi:ATP/ADP translocase